MKESLTKVVIHYESNEKKSSINLPYPQIHLSKNLINPNSDISFCN